MRMIKSTWNRDGKANTVGSKYERPRKTKKNEMYALSVFNVSLREIILIFFSSLFISLYLPIFDCESDISHKQPSSDMRPSADQMKRGEERLQDFKLATSCIVIEI